MLNLFLVPIPPAPLPSHLIFNIITICNPQLVPFSRRFSPNFSQKIIHLLPKNNLVELVPTTSSLDERNAFLNIVSISKNLIKRQEKNDGKTRKRILYFIIRFDISIRQFPVHAINDKTIQRSSIDPNLRNNSENPTIRKVFTNIRIGVVRKVESSANRWRLKIISNTFRKQTPTFLDGITNLNFEALKKTQSRLSLSEKIPGKK